MHASIVLSMLALLAPLASASLHNSGLCVDYIGDQAVYNDAATKAACTAYKNRNTGGEQWDTCPDCAMVSHSPPALYEALDSWLRKINGEKGSITELTLHSKPLVVFLRATPQRSISEVTS